MTRTVVVQQEFKTSNPVSIVTVITGTPSPNNIASYNLVTANQQVLFEVYVPVGATDSDDFLVQRQLFTRIEGPMANYHGIIRGVQIFNNFGIPGARDGTADAGPPNFAPDIVNQIVIDGQHIHWSGYGGIGIPDDLPGQNPMVVGFNAIQDIAYYMYLVGGRNNKNVSGIFNPQTSGIVDGFGSPVVLVFSNVPPLGDQSCYPSAPIGIPDRISGSTMSVRKGALFVGCGFRVKNTAFHKGCEWVGSWVHAAGGNYTAGGNNFLIAFNDAPSGIPYRTLSTTVNVAVPINTWPQVALRAKVAVYSEHGSTGSAAAVYTIGYAGTAANTVAGQQISVVPATTITAYDMVEADDPNLVASPIFPNTETLKIIVQATSFQVALHRYGEVNS
jgi:tetrahydromethanopterin S-methyltransferase subunit F